MLLRVNSLKLSHDPSNISIHIYKRAQESVEEQISRIIVKFINYQGPSPFHRVAAYAQLSTELMNELETMVFSDDNNALFSYKSEQRARQLEANRTHAMLTQDLAIKEQTIASLAADKEELENSNRELMRSNESLKKELEKALRNQAQTHQHAVEVRMQGLDYKAEVDRHCARVLTSIQSRMGFIPAGVQKEILYLKVLKAPGDPSYDEVRMHAYSKTQPIKNKNNNSNEDNGIHMDWVKRVLKAESSHVLGKSLDSSSKVDNGLSNNNNNSITGQRLTQLLSAVVDDGDDVDEEPLNDRNNSISKSTKKDKKNVKKDHRDWVKWATQPLQPIRNSSSIHTTKAMYSGSDNDNNSIENYMRSDTSTDVGKEYIDDDVSNKLLNNVEISKKYLESKTDLYTDDDYDEYISNNDNTYDNDVNNEDDYDGEISDNASKQLDVLAKKFGFSNMYRK